jgi:hypothetical protein
LGPQQLGNLGFSFPSVNLTDFFLFCGKIRQIFKNKKSEKKSVVDSFGRNFVTFVLDKAIGFFLV